MALALNVLAARKEQIKIQVKPGSFFVSYLQILRVIMSTSNALCFRIMLLYKGPQKKGIDFILKERGEKPPIT